MWQVDWEDTAEEAMAACQVGELVTQMRLAAVEQREIFRFGIHLGDRVDKTCC